MIDYKIHYIIRKSTRTIVIMDIYKGDITAEIDPPQEFLVTRYRRVQKIKTIHLEYVGEIAPTRELRNEYLRMYLNKLLLEEAQMIGETVINQQTTAIPKQYDDQITILVKYES